MTAPNIQIRFIDANGFLTLDGYRVLADMESRLSDAEAVNATLTASLASANAKIAAIAAVTAPTGGATIDSQARTTINAIRTAAS